MWRHSKNIPTILFFQTDIHIMRGLINYLSSLVNLILWRISNWQYGHYTDQMSHLQIFPTWFVLKAHQGYFSFLFYCYIGSLSKINYEKSNTSAKRKHCSTIRINTWVTKSNWDFKIPFFLMTGEISNEVSFLIIIKSR